MGLKRRNSIQGRENEEKLQNSNERRHIVIQKQNLHSSSQILQERKKEKSWPPYQAFRGRHASYAHVVTHFSDIGSRRGLNITGTLVVRASCQHYRQFSACF